jgi:ATP-dependent DNA helicase RecG
VQIIRYSNRLEIRNPGYSLIPEEQLGEPGSKTRNPKLAGVLRDVGYAENRGTGIRAMRDAMREANLTEPLFESDRGADRFSTTLFVHHLMTDDDWAWLGHFRDCDLDEDDARALIMLRDTGRLDNGKYRKITGVDTLTASRKLGRLRILGLLEQRGGGASTYYVPGLRLTSTATGDQLRFPLDAQGDSQGKGRTPKTSSQDKRQTPNANSQGKPANPAQIGSRERLHLTDLPANLAQEITSLSERPRPDVLRTLIRRLCEWHPLTAGQISHLVSRDRTYLIQQYLSPMVHAGEIEYLHPAQPNHPQQAYVVRSQDQPG